MLSQISFKHIPLPEIRFGAGCRDGLVKEVQRLGKEAALIVTDKGVRAAGLADPLAAALDEAGIHFAVFDGVEPNPQVGNVEEGATALRDLGDAVVIALGGGSALDCGKAVALAGPNPAMAAGELAFPCNPERPGQPVIALPTTAGTGSENNMFAMITDPQQTRKLYVAHRSIIPRSVFLDPELTTGLPRYPTATCGFDVLTHALEAYLSPIANPYTDALALECIRDVGLYLPRACADGQDLEARSRLLVASSNASIAFGQAGLGAVHGLGHAIGSHLHIAHGQALAAVMPEVLRFNLEASLPRLARVAFALGKGETGRDEAENARAAVTAVTELIDTVGICQNITDLGGKPEQVDDWVQDAMSDFVMRTNPRRVTKDDAAALLMASF